MVGCAPHSLRVCRGARCLFSSLFPKSSSRAWTCSVIIVIFLLWVPAFGQFVGYVPSTSGNTVTVIGTQLNTGVSALAASDNVVQVLGSSTGWKGPVRVAVSTNFATAYVTSQGDNGLWAINALNLPTFSAHASNLNGSGNTLKLNQPGGIAIAGSPSLAYVANQADGTISIVNLQNNTLVGTPLSTTSAPSSTIPEIATAGNFVYVLENSPSPSIWKVDSTSNASAVEVCPSAPGGVPCSVDNGPWKGLSAFQLFDGEITHNFIVVGDDSAGTAVVIDDGIAGATAVTLKSGALPVSITSAVSSQGPQLQDIYLADTSPGFPVWQFTIDCSGFSCSLPANAATFGAVPSATPTSIAVTPDDSDLYVSETTPAVENFCTPSGSNCPAGPTPTAITVAGGPTGVVLSDIASNSAPICFFSRGDGPSSSAVAEPASICTDTSQCSNQSALGACVQARNNPPAFSISLNFHDNFGCTDFSTPGPATGTPCGSSNPGIGGQSVYNVAGVFTTVMSGSNSNGTSSASAQTTVSADVTINASTPANQTINSGQTATLTVTASSQFQAALNYQWYLGASGNTSSPISGANSSSYTTPPLTTNTPPNNYWVQVNDGTGPVNSVTATVTVNSAPTITTQPASQSITSGSTATMSVGASGTTPFSYQWYSGTSGTTTNPISGATASSYTTPALTTTQNYWVRVSNTVGHADSNTATITVAPLTPPTITTQPASQSIASGQTATMTVAASGTSPFTYQWYSGTSGSTVSPISGATASSYTTSALTSTQSYWVRVTNSAGHADSNTATITVTQALPPSITTQPASQTVAVGQTATLTVAASGTAPLSYQWYTGNSGVTTGIITGATSSSYTTPALTSTTSYWVRVTNVAGNADSNTAVITINSGMVSTPPASTTVSAGQSLKYSITLNSGLPTLSLSCQTPLPPGVSCLFSPLQIAPGQSSTLTLATTGNNASLQHRGLTMYALAVPLSVFGLLLVSPPTTKKSRRTLRILALGLFSLLLGACGTNPNPVRTPVGSVTPPGVYTVVVVGTNSQNQIAASTPVSFTVQ